MESQATVDGKGEVQTHPRLPKGSTAAQLSTRSLTVDSTELLETQVSRKGGNSQQIQAVSAGSCTKDSPSKQVLMPVHYFRELAGASLSAVATGRDAAQGLLP